ncbi:hypothetical protein [Roseovarius rhodophyticola]|uniref:Uncharacterized protein n=1 Tax=Roseovarius rhodophyticola TaxID=3080827 RepID=A0ABZ2TFL5_9RHOB|nr:hypothetical protein [Roseovarius sp. W115]MDV2928327.1 hypothetical protein [Roseovarius sp. W115]
MQSRLETLDPKLAAELKSAALADAKERVISILSDELVTLPEKVVRLLPESFEIQSNSVSQEQIDALDSRYFDAEEAGNSEDSEALFMAARFLSAARSLHTAVNKFELCEAAYEVQFAVDHKR